MKIYLAGSLFSEVEVAGRWDEYHRAVKALPEFEIFTPVAADYNQNKSDLPTPEDIYWGDFEEILGSQYVIFDMGSALDPGLNLELGIVCGLNHHLNNKIIPIAVYSDIRLDAANQYEIPSLGYNHMVVGAFDAHGHSVKSFDEALELIKKLES